MKPSEINLSRMSRQCGKSNMYLNIVLECLRQQMLGIDEDIKNHLSFSMQSVKVEGGNKDS